MNPDQRMERLELDQPPHPMKLKRSSSDTGLKSSSPSEQPPRRLSADDCYLNLPGVKCYNEHGNLTDLKSVSCPCIADEANNHDTSCAFSLAHFGSLFPDGPSSIGGVPTIQMSPNKRSMRGSCVNVHGLSPNNSCLSSNGQMCRICLEGDRQEDLISPCICNGTMAKVHKSCLERWLNMTNGDKCELCRYAFTVDRSPRPFWQFVICDNRQTRRSALMDLLCILILTPLAGVSLYLCINSVMHHKKHSRRSSKHKRPPLWQKSTPFVTILEDNILVAENLNVEDHTDEDDLVDHVAWDVVGLVMLAFLLMGIYLTWLAAAILYHVRLWQRWRLVNQNLVLSENHRRPSWRPLHQNLVLSENHRRPSRFSVLSNTYQQMTEVPSPESFSITSITPISPCHYNSVPHINFEVDDQWEVNGSCSEEKPIAAAVVNNTGDITDKDGRLQDSQDGQFFINIPPPDYLELGDVEL